MYLFENRISDIKRTIEGLTDNVAGIYMESVQRPTVANNSITDAGNGIVFTGSDLINPPMFFQLATSLDAAIAISEGQVPATVSNGIVDLTSGGNGLQTFENVNGNVTVAKSEYQLRN